MHLYFKNIVSLIFLTFFISGCSSLLSPDKTQSLVWEQKASTALLNTNENFRRMNGIDAVLFIPKNDLNLHVSDSLQQVSRYFNERKNKVFSDVSFSSVDFNIVQQEIFSSFSFSFNVNEINQKISGHISAEHSLRAGCDQFILSTEFKNIDIDEIGQQTELSRSHENKELIASSLKNFLHLLNIEMLNSPLNIPVQMNILEGINGKDILSTKDYKLRSAKPVNMLTKMRTYMPYMYKGGLVLLGASELNQDQLQIENNMNIMAKNLNKDIDEELDKSLGIDLDTLDKGLSYYISKAYLSKQMNLALVNMDIRLVNASIINTEEENKISKSIYLYDQNLLPSCEDIKQDCSSKLNSCDMKCPLNYGSEHCQDCSKINNPFEKVRCVSTQEACKSTQELHLYECNKNEDRCEVKNSEIERACEIDNVLLMAQCQEKRDTLNSHQDIVKLSNLNILFQPLNTYAVQGVHGLRFDDDLQGLEVSRDIHISMDSRINIQATTQEHEDINCSIGVSKNVDMHSYSDLKGLNRRIELFTQVRPDGYMLLKGIGETDFKTVTLSKAPFTQLLDNKNFTLSCSYQGMPMSNISSQELLNKQDIPYALNIMHGEMELNFEEEEFSFVISPVKLSFETVLYPIMENKSIGFTQQGQFY